MTGKQMREYLKPLSWQERAKFIIDASASYEDLPWEKRRELQEKNIQMTENKLHLSLKEKVELAFARGALRMKESFHTRFPEKSNPEDMKLTERLKIPKSPYLLHSPLKSA